MMLLYLTIGSLVPVGFMLLIFECRPNWELEKVVATAYLIGMPVAILIVFAIANLTQ